MGKRYTVSTQIALQQNNDATQIEFSKQIDLALLLSQRLQRNVRQGHVFKLHKVAFGLTPSTGQDLDTGLAVSGFVAHCPATKNSVRSWQMVFDAWRKQKQLTLGATGKHVRYDDFEIGWNNTTKDVSRNSHLLSTGMSDSTLEDVVIYGSSTPSHCVTLEDLYESLQEQAPPSRFPFDNLPVKLSKFTEEFPQPVITNFGGHWSTIATDSLDSGANYNFDPVFVEDKNTLAGVLQLQGYVLAEDAGFAIEDGLKLRMSFTVEISTPLAKSRKPKSRRYKRKGGAKRGRSSRYRRRK